MNEEGLCRVCGSYDWLHTEESCLFCFRWAMTYHDPLYDLNYIDKWGYLPEFHPKAVNSHLRRKNEDT